MLNEIDRGSVSLLTHTELGACGTTPVFLFSNGWEFCIFDDCGEWDYIEWVESPDGWRVTFDDMVGEHGNAWNDYTMPELYAYSPPDHTLTFLGSWGGLR